jgi:AcrR family transcriptional regulator
MTSSTPTPPLKSRRAGARADKRSAITTGARTVFGRDGYSLTSIEAIAGEAGVSTRTIYNHFESKEQLFAALLEESSTQVSDAFIARVGRDFVAATPRENLLALGSAFLARRTDFPAHFALIDRFRGEVIHMPRPVIESWRRSGPLRVEREVIRRLLQLANDGLLTIDNPRRAARHFTALLISEITDPATGLVTAAPRKSRDCVVAAVDAFLNGYGAKGEQR